ncbi:murein hydrolase activator EnvC [uncultured Ruminococcus sp.]|uniref:murein hydrolase activator EnvC family protein n=1 Tax=uncultured Ruminococcus sp. TaxID=165186 RepID=UPI00260B9FD8|nr:M23 family metallopeptidase [uncultured Ruminococcus sp.]
MSRKKHIGRRLTGAALCLSILAAGMTANWAPLRDIPVSAKTLAELQEERKSNEAKIAEKQKELDALQTNLEEKEAYQQTLQEKITLQQQNLDIVVEELDRINQSIEETTAAISQTEDDITVMEADIAIGLDQFKLRLRAMYVQGNNSLASALVGATDFYDLLSKYELMSRVANHDNELVNDLKDKLEACNEKKAQLEQEKSDLEQQQSEQQTKKEEFKSAIEELQTTYAETDEAKQQMEREKEKLNVDVDTLEKNNAALDAEEEQIKAEIARAAEEQKKKEEEERKKREAAAAAKKQQEEEKKQNSNSGSSNSSSSSGSSSSGGSSSNSGSSSSDSGSSSDSSYVPSGSTNFTWPCPGFYTVSSGFGSRWGTTHGAIDIAGGNAGAAVVASRGGTVVRVVSGCPHNYPKSSSCGCGGGYGNYVIIQHDGTYSTLYGHLASVSVSAGQTVSQGQTIGYVGSTGFSTGFHLHFEVRVNGTKVDPMQYLG